MRRKIIAFDFDGTVCENTFPKLGNPKTDVIDYLKELRRQGWILILWTCREGEYLKEAIGFCRENGIEPDYVNENADYVDLKSRKIFADIYLDDKAKKESDDFNCVQPGFENGKWVPSSVFYSHND